MIQLFAHHDGGLMRSLDFLHLDPQTPLEHVVALASYVLTVGAVAAGVLSLGILGVAGRKLLVRRGRRRVELRTMEG